MHNKKIAATNPEALEASASKLDWDDLRHVLAVARHGSLSGAARALRVTHSTMLRRIDAVEGKLQTRLFERLRDGYVATEAGELLRRAAEQCEPLVAEAERLVIGGDTRLTGSLRITTAPVIALHLLPPVLAKFCGAHPDIEVELQTSLERVDLSRREADVALRVAHKVPDYLVGRVVGELRMRIYAWPGAPFLAAGKRISKPLPVDAVIRDFPWISFERDVLERPSNRWLQANVPASSVVLRVDHFPSALAMLRTGIGVALLPEIVTNDAPELVALTAPIEELDMPIWILTHPDLRNSARVRAFLQMAGDEIGRLAGPRRP
ncbi:MAG TPA: LysR family transcriptional regulator [Paucimonas sp.]|nr:LysR family transcriptional regulator [Paucimonas sp.]